MTPIAEFTINVRTGPKRRSSDRFTVRVFRNRIDMWAYWARQVETGYAGGRTVGRLNFLGQASYWGRPHGREVGQVLICADAIGAGVVAHEMCHAALYYTTLKLGLKPSTLDKKADETLAWITGWLTSRFWVAFYRLKLPGGRAA